MRLWLTSAAANRALGLSGGYGGGTAAASGEDVVVFSGYLVFNNGGTIPLGKCAVRGPAPSEALVDVIGSASLSASAVLNRALGGDWRRRRNEYGRD